MDCPYCTMPYMQWRMDETTSNGKIWDTNLGLWHDCEKSPEAIKKNKDAEFLKERQEILREQILRKIGKLKTPIYCVGCGKARYASEPCKHMIADGFELGVDGGDFYSDSYKAKDRRKYLRSIKEKKLIKKHNLDSFK